MANSESGNREPKHLAAIETHLAALAAELATAHVEAHAARHEAAALRVELAAVQAERDALRGRQSGGTFPSYETWRSGLMHGSTARLRRVTW